MWHIMTTILENLWHKNPQRSWAKTYTQLWTLAMRDPISQKQSSGTFNNHANKTKVECCWRYNRNQCKKNAKDCKFEHKCSFCGIYNHSYVNCRKRRSNGSGDSATANGGQMQNKGKDNHANKSVH